MFAGVLMPLPYIVYAVIQTVRGKVNITGFGTLLAYAAVLIPLIIIAIQTVNDVEPAILTVAAIASGVAVAIFSLILLIRDLRRPDRTLNQSYGVLGIGVGVLVIAGTLLTPTVLEQVSSLMGVSSANTTAATAAAAGGGNFAAGNFQAPELTADMASSALVQTIATASGLTGEAVIEQITSGTSIQAMVSNGGGDVAAVTSAITSAVEQAINDGTLNSQMLTRFGDAATFADQLVQGALPGQLGQTMLVQLISGGSALPDAGSFAPPANAAAPADATTANPAAADQTVVDQTQTSADQTTGSSERPAGFPEAPAGFAMPGGSGGGSDSASGAAAQPAATEEARPTATSLPTSTPVPTQTPRPTSTPFPTFAPTSTVAPAATCSVLVNFNLNLRSGPNADDDLLLTIPFGTIVTASDHNADDWWQVTYEDVSGWISGEYVTVMAGCEM